MKLDTTTTLQQVLDEHRKWLNNNQGSRANLSGADLYGANLRSANLSRTIYENDIPIIINTEFYNIVKTKAFVKIGCQTHTLKEWEKFTDDEIRKMDGQKAIDFWNRYKLIILTRIN